MEASSSSKVTVEYHDPSGVFPLVSRDIAARLPLRNLNWQSQARPLRQIKSLHVDFVPDEYTRTALSNNGSNSIDSDHAKQAGASKQRRHQIPGLKTSPYLKIYVLRCDDKDTYKASERKKLRDWFKENVQPDSKREKHDASEWMILHVVLPDTVASSEPRWRESTRDPDELKERSKSNLKLPGKSTRTVFDKLRADFNESVKTGPDRVAQIRLLKNQVPPDLLPTPAIAQTLNESAQERENAWADLVTKFKTLILIPFDARVRQYEEDIAEQESRRSLPGWNFCTFFIHKEGLAKALESVGLVEDALVIYDELNLGLETVIRDLASGNAEGTLTSFEPTSKDLQQRITGSASTAANGTAGTRHSGLFDKDYREDIVRSQISIFDFFCYLFSRQKALILRLAGAELARTEFGTNFKEGGEDLVLLAEVCWRTLSFVHNTGRTLRQDLANGSQHAQHSPYDTEALISSWTFSVAGQVLAETETVLLDPNAERPTSAGSIKDGAQAKAKRREFDFAMGGNAYPERSSSLRTEAKRPASSSGKPSRPDSGAPQVRLQSPPAVERQRMEEGTYGPQGAAGGQEIKLPDKPGLVELSAYRAALVMMRRKMLELLAKRRGWVTGWAGMKVAAAKPEDGSETKQDEKLEDVGLEDDESSTADSESKSETDDDEEALKTSASSTRKQPPQSASPISDLLTPPLAIALTSESSFQEAFETLSSAAIRHYLAATHTKSAETITGDIAMLKFQQREYATAATYFEHVLPLYGTDAWSLMEAQALDVYLQCLRELGRHSDFAKSIVSYLRAVVGRKMRSHGRKGDNGSVSVDGYLTQLVGVSAGFGEEIDVNMKHFFSDITLRHDIGHLEDRDGFSWSMSFEHLLPDEVQVDEMKVKLVGVEDSAMEIWLSALSPPILRPGKVDIILHSSSTATGPFYVDTITMKAKKLQFTHELQPQPERNALGVTTTPETRDEKPTKRPFLLLYPPVQAFDVTVELSRTIHIDKTKHLEITLSSGWNDIQQINLRLRPKSAGLRLHVADATADGLQRTSGDGGKPGSIALGELTRDAKAAVKVPYTLEQAATGILIRLEAVYQTAHGVFTFLAAVKLPTVLPLDVDVNDVFHHDALFSTFTIRTTNRCPLAISHAELAESPAYAVEQPPVQVLPMTVFENVPLTLMYKITRKSAANVAKVAAALVLTVRYQPFDEPILRAMSVSFASELEASGFGYLRRLLMPLLQERVRQRLSSREVHAAVFAGEAKAPSFADLGWFEVVDTLPQTMQRGLSDWLLKWHIEHPRIAIELDGNTAEKEIRLRVEIPNLDVVFSTAITLAEDARYDDEDMECLSVVGQAIQAEMIVKYTKSWSTESIFGKEGKKSAAGEKEKTFVLNIQADTETWLVGGSKRKQFNLPASATAAVALNLPLVLVPLKLGLHALPTIDVQIYPGGEEGQPVETTMSCETHCQSAGVVVRVIRDVRTTKVKIVEGDDE